MVSLPANIVGDTSLEAFCDLISVPSSSSSSSLTYTPLDKTISYHLTIPWNIRILAPGVGPSPSSSVEGLLYTPDLPSGDSDNDACIAQLKAYVPDAVTRKSDLPNGGSGEKLVALAPWLTGDHECAGQYLAAAQGDGVNGFLFYIPGNSTDAPTPPSGLVWNLNGSNEWQTTIPFPVFALPSKHASTLMDQSALYSANISDVPHGGLLTKKYSPQDYVRLYVQVNTGGTSSLPNLWVLLLIVLAVVLGIMGFLSLLMHWLQMRRRRDLRRRVESGEVDLEALGIKRLTVPVEVLEKMPVYEYGSGKAATAAATVAATNKSAAAAAAATPVANGETEKSKTTVESTARPMSPSSPPALNSSWPAPAIHRPPVVTRPSHKPTALLQPSCPICLEEFVSAKSPPPNTTEASTPTTTTTDTDTTTTPQQEPATVRELPCQHIFHPQCIDTFLSSTSSLCPMCKTAALPKGYCPSKITNAMVRREKLVRRRGLEAVVADENARNRMYRMYTGPGRGLRSGGDNGGGRMSPRSRSRVVGWGAGVANLPPHYERVRLQFLNSAAGRGRMMGRDASAAAAGQQPPAQEMTDMSGTRQTTSPSEAQTATLAPTTAPAASTTTTTSVPQPSTSTTTPEGRREWARQRAVDMLGIRAAPTDPDAEEARTMPWWKKAVQGVFPNTRQ